MNVILNSFQNQILNQVQDDSRKNMPEDFPSISVIIPTLNSERVLRECLASVAKQDYPRELIEVLIADGDSVDKTREIAKDFGAKILENPLKTGEAGKAVGSKYAKNEVLAFIDSDNILPDKSWFKKMVAPFTDSEIIAAEPLYYTYRKEDSILTRYFSLLGMGDPLSLFLGNYDRFSFLTNKWTQIKLPTEEYQDFLEITLEGEHFPTIGANGFLIRRAVLFSVELGDYLFDVDVLHVLSKKRTIKIAKVKVGIVHEFCDSFSTFIRKQKRRIKDYLYYSKSGLRETMSPPLGGIVKFIIFTLLVFPLIFQSLIGFSRKRDLAWFLHPLVCWITLVVYSTGKIKGIVKIDKMTREGYSQ